MSWLSLGNELNLLKRWNPARPVVQWYNSHVMDRFLDRELDKYFEPSSSTVMDSKQATMPSKSIIGLSVANYMKDKDFGKHDKMMDKAFRDFTKTQIRTFLFAGHDTTSSSMCYIYHLLCRSPSTLEKLRAEHNTVFGEDLAGAESILSTQPQLINQVPYTTGVIKEALRLFPPSSSMREGSADFSIIGPDGTGYPTEGTLIWVMHQSLHRNPASWIRADEFLPQRWLVGPEHELHPVKDAWRPFEFGPRNCLGQELAMLELKAVLILTCREFDILTAYDEWDRRYPRKGPKMVNDDRLYQIERVGAHPADGFPCKVQLRK